MCASAVGLFALVKCGVSAKVYEGPRFVMSYNVRIYVVYFLNFHRQHHIFQLLDSWSAMIGTLPGT